jgi:predicted RecA/RadA family phage recombinase
MKTFIAEGCSLEYTAGSDLLSGAVVALGMGVGVLDTDIANGAKGTAHVRGVFSLAKATGTAWTEGDKLYWDAGASKFTKTALGNKPAGFAHAPAASGDATGYVNLQPSVESMPGDVQAAVVSFSAGSNLVGVDGAGSNAAPLAGTETRLDSLDTAVAAILTSIKAAGLMASS